MKLLMILLLMVTNLHAGAGARAAAFAGFMAASRHGSSREVDDMQWYLKLRDSIMKRAERIAGQESGAKYIQMIHSFTISSSRCTLPPFFVIKIMDASKRDIAFMLWGFDTTSGSHKWRLIIYENRLEDFNRYCSNTPFFEAVIKDPSIRITTVC